MAEQAESLSTPGQVRARVVVIAERLDDVVVVTPRRLHAAHGVVGERLVVAESMHRHPMYDELLDEVLPAFATREEPATPAPSAPPVFSQTE